MTPRERVRCAWARTGPSIPCHDAEWGVPRHDDGFDAYIWRFVGSTVMYAFMRAVGMVNDHLVACPRGRDLS